MLVSDGIDLNIKECWFQTYLVFPIEATFDAYCPTNGSIESSHINQLVSFPSFKRSLIGTGTK